jgi:hypothetical protein
MYIYRDIIGKIHYQSSCGPREASKIYYILRATLQFRSSTKFSSKTSHGPKPILTSDEETLLEKLILASHRKGFPPQNRRRTSIGEIFSRCNSQRKSTQEQSSWKRMVRSMFKTPSEHHAKQLVQL